MLSSVDALFLAALGLTTWWVVGYFQVLEQHNSSQDFDVELYTEHHGVTYKQRSCENHSAGVPRFVLTFEIMASFGILFCLTYAMVMALKFVAARVRLFRQEEHVEEEDYPRQLREKVSKLGERFMLMHELLIEQRFSGGLEQQTSGSDSEPKSSGSGSEPKTSGSASEPKESGSGCLELQATANVCLEIQPRGSSCTNIGHGNDDSHSELWNQKKDLCSGSTRGTNNVANVSTAPQSAVSSQSNHFIYINSSQIHIHANINNTESINLEQGQASGKQLQCWPACAIPTCT
ncbi:uncharacterized protein LOC117580378 isoform X2 [Drosophila guanche]|uniref:uncharacterized protein LOC117580378 isoform X2 n=1 Tax=Drosophila guanche TaxID=7266 RepID=UPI001471A1D4|nr:uncharacterized protein LOC117580378 isoform X2 [Drosophila guanche]